MEYSPLKFWENVHPTIFVMCHVSQVICHVGLVTYHVSQKITCDTWHMTRDMWPVTRDTWWMTHIVGWTFSQNFSSLALPVWDWGCLEHISTKGWVNEWLNESINPSVTEVIVEQPWLHWVCYICLMVTVGVTNNVYYWLMVIKFYCKQSISNVDFCVYLNIFPPKMLGR